MADYDIRSSAGWNYKVLPIEQLYIQAPRTSSTLKIDYILKGGVYNFEPIIRARDANAVTQKIIGYNIGVTVDLLFNDLGTYVEMFEDDFAGQEVTLWIYLSSKNIVGVDEWKRIVISNIRMNYSIIKNDNQPVIRLNFSGSASRTGASGIKSFFSSWNATEPA